MSGGGVVNMASVTNPDSFFQKLMSYGDVESAIAIYIEFANEWDGLERYSLTLNKIER